MLYLTLLAFVFILEFFKFLFRRTKQIAGHSPEKFEDHSVKNLQTEAVDVISPILQSESMAHYPLHFEVIARCQQSFDVMELFSIEFEDMKRRSSSFKNMAHSPIYLDEMTPCPSDSEEKIPCPSDCEDMIPRPSDCEDMIPCHSDCEDMIPRPSDCEDMIPCPSNCEDMVPCPSDCEDMIPCPLDCENMIPYRLDCENMIPYRLDCENMIPYRLDCENMIPYRLDCENMIPYRLDCENMIPFPLDFKFELPSIADSEEITDLSFESFEQMDSSFDSQDETDSILYSDMISRPLKELNFEEYENISKARYRFFLSHKNELNLHEKFSSKRFILVTPIDFSGEKKLYILLEALKMYDDAFKNEENITPILCIILGREKDIESDKEKIESIDSKFVTIRTWDPPINEYEELLNYCHCGIFLNSSSKNVIHPKLIDMIASIVPVFGYNNQSIDSNTIDYINHSLFIDAKELYDLFQNSFIKIDGKIESIKKKKVDIKKEEHFVFYRSLAKYF